MPRDASEFWSGPVDTLKPTHILDSLTDWTCFAGNPAKNNIHAAHSDFRVKRVKRVVIDGIHSRHAAGLKVGDATNRTYRKYVITITAVLWEGGHGQQRVRR